jgi:hypothetical protein
MAHLLSSQVRHKIQSRKYLKSPLTLPLSPPGRGRGEGECRRSNLIKNSDLMSIEKLDDIPDVFHFLKISDH